MQRDVVVKSKVFVVKFEETIPMFRGFFMLKKPKWSPYVWWSKIRIFHLAPSGKRWHSYGSSQFEWVNQLSGWWFGCHQFYLPRNIGFMSSSQLNPILSYVSEGWPNHQPDYKWCMFNSYVTNCQMSPHACFFLRISLHETSSSLTTWRRKFWLPPGEGRGGKGEAAGTSADGRDEKMSHQLW